MVKVRSSRRVAGLKPSDYDHEIGLVEHNGAEDDSGSTSESASNTQRGSMTSRLVSFVEETEQERGQQQASGSRDGQQTARASPVQDVDAARHPALSRLDEDRSPSQLSLPYSAMQPSIEVQGKPDAGSRNHL